jgi:hypothetical protein
VEELQVPTMVLKENKISYMSLYYMSLMNLFIVNLYIYFSYVKAHMLHLKACLYRIYIILQLLTFLAMKKVSATHKTFTLKYSLFEVAVK